MCVAGWHQRWSCVRHQRRMRTPINLISGLWASRWSRQLKWSLHTTLSTPWECCWRSPSHPHPHWPTLEYGESVHPFVHSNPNTSLHSDVLNLSTNLFPLSSFYYFIFPFTLSNMCLQWICKFIPLDSFIHSSISSFLFPHYHISHISTTSISHISHITYINYINLFIHNSMNSGQHTSIVNSSMYYASIFLQCPTCFCNESVYPSIDPHCPLKL